MKNLSRTWKIVSFVELIAYIGLTIIIFIRQSDGAGINQSPTLKIITWGILTAFCFVLLIIQIIWAWIAHK
ncbi:DUF3923 family protein [Fructilactobacillus cliffordii]|uniref:DUF3923 family protein n=1 Tax=Fructilactobacillus cliffordii TaxID=2940299 RepID=UPI002092E2EC|nr:DUF3923 family protein [Fructilactobacillus cliffordii]USS86081.1 DUF3923 family protein [Fructilactobacillus cliffordii]